MLQKLFEGLMKDADGVREEFKKLTVDEKVKVKTELIDLFDDIISNFESMSTTSESMLKIKENFGKDFTDEEVVLMTSTYPTNLKELDQDTFGEDFYYYYSVKIIHMSGVHVQNYITMGENCQKVFKFFEEEYLRMEKERNGKK